MRKQFVASPLSSGNHLFRSSITITDSGVLLRIPGFWKNKETHFEYTDITGISINMPRWYAITSFVSMGFNARGNWVEIHGFTRADCEEIKKLIKSGQSGSSESQSSAVNTRNSNEDSKALKREREQEGLRESIAELAGDYFIQNEEKISLAQEALTKVLINLHLFRYNNDKLNIDKSQKEIVHIKKLLMRFLTDRFLNENAHFDRPRFDIIVQECRDRAKAKALSIIQNKSDKNENEIWDELMNEARSNDAIIDGLILIYDQLDIEIIETNELSSGQKRLLEVFVQNIVSDEGRTRIFRLLSESMKDSPNDPFVSTLHSLSTLIDKIFESGITDIYIDNTKKKYPFALTNPKVVAYLKDSKNSITDRLTKVIDVTDNLIDRLDKRGMM
jgi:hypothetical protein